MLFYVKDWFTRPRWVFWLSTMPSVLFLPFWSLMGSAMMPFMVLQEGAGPLKTTRPLPLSMRDQATAFWMIGVLILPLCCVLCYCLHDSVHPILAIDRTPVPLIWLPHRIIMVLGAAGWAFAWVGYSYPKGGPNTGRVWMLPVLIMGALFALDKYVRTQPVAPFLICAWLLGIGLPVSWIFRETCVRGLLRVQEKATAQESSRVTLVDRMHAAGMPALALARFGVALVTAFLFAAFLLLSYRLPLWFNVFGAEASAKAGEITNVPQALQAIIISTVAVQGLWPSLKGLRTLPLSTTQLTLWVGAINLAGSLAGLCAVGLLNVFLLGALNLADLRFASVIALGMLWQVPLSLRFSLMAGMFIALSSIIACVIAGLIFLEMYGFEEPAMAYDLAIPALAIATLPAFLWTRHQLRHNNRNYQLAKWQPMLARKG